MEFKFYVNYFTSTTLRRMKNCESSWTSGILVLSIGFTGKSRDDLSDMRLYATVSSFFFAHVSVVHFQLNSHIRFISMFSLLSHELFLLYHLFRSTLESHI